MTRPIAFGGAVLFLAGCATSDTMRVGARRAPTDPATVRVLLEEPNEPYTAIAIIEASDQGWGKSLDALKERLVRDAAKAGGQAVIIGQRGTKDGGTVFMPMGVGVYGVAVEAKTLAGKVIVFE